MGRFTSLEAFLKVVRKLKAGGVLLSPLCDLFPKASGGNCLIYATAWIEKLEYDVTVSRKRKKTDELHLLARLLSLLSVSPFF